jgi:signal transduction histidine kinase/ActR/RegA family two-component response regulator
MTRRRDPNPERVLVLVRGQRDAEVTLRILGREGLNVHVCSTASELCSEIEIGGGAALLAEEVLSRPVLRALEDVLAKQPAWSDFPLVVFASSERLLGDEGRVPGNVTFLERPVQVRSMLASVRSAINSRHRQYEARRAIESRDAFLAMLGHELRNPLNAIRLAVALLEQQSVEGERPREHVIIDRQSRHLARLVDDLLDVARIRHGKVVLRRVRENLVHISRSAFDTFEMSAKTQGLDYQFHTTHEEIWVDADRQRLEPVFNNLLTNAIKYTPRGGTIRMSVIRGESAAMVRVSDDGIGIAPEMREKIFDVFAQIDATLARSRGGIGLGLAIVRNIVQLHDGSVYAQSAGLGHGSTFVVELGYSMAPASDAPRPRAVSGAMARARRVVLVEDGDDIRELLTETVRRLGHHVTCAKDGPSGVAAILTSAPDIAFVDVGLPGFDGLEVARRLREWGFRAPLVALTGYGQSEDKHRAHEAGFTEHLTKPVSGTQIADVIRRLVGDPTPAVA